MMIQRFSAFITQHNLFRPQDRLLLAVSGGVDSVVMAHLFALAGYRFEIAHANFQLRGGESDSDEAFVRDLAQQLAVPVHVKRFDVQAAVASGVTVQMAAREMRYEWFASLCAERDCVAVATAHHQDDAIETAVHHFVRGTGVAGLRGILPHHTGVIRPMLWARKAEIQAFASSEGFSFREDSSNTDTKYTRNRIRRELLPLLRTINPGFDSAMIQSMAHHRDTELMQQEVLRRLRKRLLLKRHNEWFIPILGLKKLPYRHTVLFHLVQGFGFNSEQVNDIIRHLDGQPGKIFMSATHRLIKDRRFLIVATNEPTSATWVSVDAEQESVSGDGIRLRCRRLPASDFKPEESPRVAALDVSRLEFPLVLRRWKQGDYFYPFGMKGKKKVSKYFKDEKIPVTEKERVWILLSGDKVVWVVGYRLDNRFRITAQTETAYRVEVIT
jgi:tRNA(Ile)-lysidine synthase